MYTPDNRIRQAIEAITQAMLLVGIPGATLVYFAGLWVVPVELDWQASWHEPLLAATSGGAWMICALAAALTGVNLMYQRWLSALVYALSFVVAIICVLHGTHYGLASHIGQGLEVAKQGCWEPASVACVMRQSPRSSFSDPKQLADYSSPSCQGLQVSSPNGLEPEELNDLRSCAAVQHRQRGFRASGRDGMLSALFPLYPMTFIKVEPSEHALVTSTETDNDRVTLHPSPR